VSKEQREQLFHFVHDWFQQVCDENQAIENMDKTPSDVLCDEMEKLNGLYERLMKNNQKFRIN
jgi:hypothetical protein